jgi:adenine phosphoribosyltransferase
MTAPEPLDLSQYIRSIPDFPKPGILFRDITPLLACPRAFRCAIDELTRRAQDLRVQSIVAAEARGFLLAAPLALELGAALVPVRKRGKLPGKVISCTYDLEYGSDTLEIHAGSITAGARVLVVDDLLATGGTVEACCRLVEKAEGTVAGCAFLVELTALGGAKRIARYPTITLIRDAGP